LAQRIIENPVINSPFSEPSKYFRFDDEGSRAEIVEVVAPALLPADRTTTQA
jgi:type III restriction enzyme